MPNEPTWDDTSETAPDWESTTAVAEPPVPAQAANPRNEQIGPTSLAQQVRRFLEPTEPIKAQLAVGASGNESLLGTTEKIPLTGEKTPLEYGKAAINAGNEALVGLTSLSGIEALPLFALPGAAEVYAGKVATELPAQGRQLKEIYSKEGLSPKLLETGAGIGLNDLMAVLGMKGAHAARAGVEGTTLGEHIDKLVNPEVVPPDQVPTPELQAVTPTSETPLPPEQTPVTEVAPPAADLTTTSEIPPKITADAAQLPAEVTPNAQTTDLSPAGTAGVPAPEVVGATPGQGDAASSSAPVAQDVAAPGPAGVETTPAEALTPKAEPPAQGVPGSVPAPEAQHAQTQVASAPEPSKLHTVLQKLDLTREDLNSIGAAAPGTKRTGLLIDRGQHMVRDLADVVGGKVLPKLTRSGVMDEAVQHASARQYVPALVQELQSKVFPNTYKDLDAMARTIDVIKADNILGGYDDAVAALEDLKNAPEPNINAIMEQEAFLQGIEASQDLPALDAQVQGAKGTDIEGDIHRWEKHVTSLMDNLYNELKGADPNTPRETRGRYYEARMNLLPEESAARLADFADPDKPMPEAAVSNYRNPNLKRDSFMRQAQLTGKYSSDPNLVLLNSFANRWNEVTKLRLYKSLQDSGVAVISEPGAKPITELGGKPIGRMAIKMPETNPVTGRTQMVERSMFVQRELVPEIRSVLNTDGRVNTHPVFQAITQLQLLQLADATAHTKNIHSVVVNALGDTSMGRDLLRKIPGLGTAAAVTEISKVSKQIAADSPEIRAEIADLTKRGMIRPSYPSTGVQKITRMQDLIHGVDTASRVIMNRRFNNLVERGLAKDTIENRRNFIQQIGEYNRRLMSRNEAYMRDRGISPFIVAGRTFNRFSRRLVTASTGFETASGKAAATARAAQMSGLVFAATVPALINVFTTGSMGGRKGTPVGAIDFGPAYDTEDGKHRQLDLFQLTGIRRGLRGTGIEAAIEGYRNGEDLNTIAGKAADGIVTTAAHPFIGPGLGGVLQTLTGKRLDLRTGWNVSVPDARKIGGGKQLLENFRVAIKTQNPFLYGIVQNGLQNGMDKVFGIPPEEDAPSALQQTGSGLVKSSLGAVGYKEVRPPEKPAKLSRKAR